MGKMNIRRIEKEDLKSIVDAEFSIHALSEFGISAECLLKKNSAQKELLTDC